MKTSDVPLARRLRIGYLVPPSHVLAGIERVTHEIAEGLAVQARDRLEVHVIYASDYPELERLAQESSYRLECLHRSRNLRMGGPLRRYVRRHRLDVLVTPQVEASVIAWVSTRGTGLRVLVPHLHGNPRIEFDEGTSRTRWAFRFFRQILAPRVPLILAVSPSLRDYASKTVAKATKVVFVPNPVAERPGLAEAWVADPKTFRMVSIGRLSRQKGQDLMLEAVHAARDRLPNFTLTVVGAGDELEWLKTLTTRLGLDDVVTFVGHAAPDAYLRQADCLVLASRWEGFGVVLVEALQAGVPLLTTDCDFGPRDVVVSDHIGILVQPDNPKALADGMVSMATRVRDLQDVSARTAVAQRFEPGNAIAEHAAIFDALGLNAIEPSSASRRQPGASTPT